MQETIPIPVKTIGPIKIIGSEVNTEVEVRLATFETPMWPSTNRGASVTRKCAGLQCTIFDDRMTRSILLEGEDAHSVMLVLNELNKNEAIAQVVSSTSRFCRNVSWHTQVVGNLLFLRLEATTGDASGHNMLTKAADAVINWLLENYPSLKYVSISGNICVDKKVSAINGLLGRGKYVIADMLIPRAVCQERLKTTPEALINLHIKKNLMGSIVSGVCALQMRILLICSTLFTSRRGKTLLISSKALKGSLTLKCATATSIFLLRYLILLWALWAMENITILLKNIYAF